MTAKPQPGPGQTSDYYYRRVLTLKELVPAIGVGVGAGLVAFYVARLFVQRTPLVTVRDIPALGPVPQPSPRSASPRSRPQLAPSPTITRRAARRADAG